MEAAELGLFMISAGLFTTLLEYSGSPVHQAIGNAFVRRVLMGIAMGSTAVAIIYSPWGKQSGAHFNPSVTWTFFQLGKVKFTDAAMYTLAQFIGGTIGIIFIGSLIGNAIAQPPVQFAATLPIPNGMSVAFGAELVISFLLISIVLRVSNTPGIARYTGLCAGMLVSLYIIVESPLSGMSMNPARTFASALAANLWTGLWIYFTAPPLGMLAAAKVYAMQKGPANVKCAKLHHQNSKRCIFCQL